MGPRSGRPHQLVHVPDPGTAEVRTDAAGQGGSVRPPTPDTELFVPAADGGAHSADNGAHQHQSTDRST
jgi:hypothetical protein